MKITRRQLKQIINEELDLSKIYGQPKDSGFFSRIAGLTSDQADSDIVTTSQSDPYEYKYDSGTWKTRKKRSRSSWITITDSKAIAALSYRFLDVGGAAGEGELEDIERGESDKSLITRIKDFFFDSDDGEESMSSEPIIYQADLPFAQGKKLRPDHERMLKKGEEVSSLYKCGTSKCAQYVSNTLDRYQGNAWPAHGYTDRTLDSSFNENVSNNEILDALSSVFTLLNRKNGGSQSDNSKVKSIVSSMIPDQTRWSDLALGDIVGLYHPESPSHYKAFFEAATGTSIGVEGQREKIAGVFFLNKETGEPWKTSDMGKNIKFKPGKTLKSGKSFGMNTHMGFVGAKYNGQPIIFHNVKGTVSATPLSAMGKKDFIMWAKKPSEKIS